MDHDNIVQAMLDPKTYDEPVHGEIRMMQTHISWVFLTGDYAYKVKKPVDFGFLDFTTLEKRKRFCELELELNRRLCPEMYLDVLPVAQEPNNPGRLHIDGKGNVVEHVLKMKQLPQEKLMDKLLDSGKIGKDVIDRIAKMMAEFHSKADNSGKISAYGKPDKLRFNWEENFEQAKPFAGKVISMEDIDNAKKRIEGFMAGNEHLFEKRVKDGKVRRVHGDLHSGNIFIIDGRPCIFDCIEFNMRFSCQDVAGDVAFFCMDLDFKGRSGLADFFVKRYLHYSGDSEMKQLLDFYKCYYAWVRGKVTAFRLNEELSGQERKKVEETSRRYFRLALTYGNMRG